MQAIVLTEPWLHRTERRRSGLSLLIAGSIVLVVIALPLGLGGWLIRNFFFGSDPPSESNLVIVPAYLVGFVGVLIASFGVMKLAFSEKWTLTDRGIWMRGSVFGFVGWSHIDDWALLIWRNMNDGFQQVESKLIEIDRLCPPVLEIATKDRVVTFGPLRFRIHGKTHRIRLNDDVPAISRIFLEHSVPEREVRSEEIRAKDQTQSTTNAN